MGRSGRAVALSVCCVLVLGLAGCGNMTTTTAASSTVTTGKESAAATTTTLKQPVPGIWTQVDPAGESPAARGAFCMVSDSDSGRVVLFGGWDGTEYFDDTWSYQPALNLWTELGPQGETPAARSNPAMAYDPASGKVVLFGGYDGSRFLDDTWSYDPAGNTWTELDPPGKIPDARAGHALVYLPQTGETILFGGANDKKCFKDTWAYDPAANRWTNLSPSGAGPSARVGVGMACDTRDGKIILFGGWRGRASFDDTWVYDRGANSWTEARPAGDTPPGRGDMAMAYDAAAGLVVLFGGGTQTRGYGDTWAYDSATNSWEERSTIFSVQTIVAGHAMVYDSSSGWLIAFGGWDNSEAGFADNTWVYVTRP